MLTHDASTPHISIGLPFSEASLVARKRDVLGREPDPAVAMSDWVKLHRRLRDSAFYGQAIPVALWVECLLRASWESKERFIGRTKVKLDAGAFVMGYSEMGDAVGCSASTVKAWMDIFEKEGMVERQSNGLGTICKLKKWSEYQEGRTPKERTENADRTPKVSNKNIKNDKNSDVHTSSTVSSSPDVVGASAPSTETPKSYAMRFFAKDKDAWLAERDFFVSRGCPEEVCRDQFARFMHYWTELTPGGKKQRWETQTTFEVRRRLVTWIDRAAKDYTKKGGSLTMPDFRSQPTP